MTPAMQPLNTSYDAVVIGSGHNGLVAAAHHASLLQNRCFLEHVIVNAGRRPWHPRPRWGSACFRGVSAAS